MTEQLTYNIEQAAAKLGGPFTRDWLVGHLAEIPHIKVGKGTGRSGRIGFSELHLAQIVDMFVVEAPTPAPEVEFRGIKTRRNSVRRSA